MTGVLGGLAVFGAVIAVGWALVRTGAVGAGTDSVLTRVCFFAATPALLVLTLGGADLSAVTNAGAAVALAAQALGIVGAWLVHRFLLRRTVAEATVGALASGYVNAVNLGIPVMLLVVGDVAPVAPLLLVQLLVFTPTTFAILDTATRRGRHSRLAVLTLSLRNPLLLAVTTGVVLNLCGVDLEAVLAGHLFEALSLLGRTAVPLMMLSLGMSLAASQMAVRGEGARGGVTEPGEVARGMAAPGEAVRSETESRAKDRVALWWAVAWKLAVVPGLAVGLGLASGLGGRALLVPVTAACLPTAQNVFLYASRYGTAKPLARDAVLITTAGFVPVVLLAAALLT